MSNLKFKVGSLYAGVGGICLGFKQAGYEISWSNEWDKNACITYRNNFKHNLIEGDIWKINEKSLQKVDIIIAGFPCQSFSVAGYRKGFKDERGTHFFRIIDFIDYHEPKAIFLENVKNLKSKNIKFSLLNWDFVTGDKNEIYEIANSYFVNVSPDSLAPGGFLHSEYFVIIDKQGRVRSGIDKNNNVVGVYDGTNDAQMKDLISDIKVLLAEYKRPIKVKDE